MMNPINEIITENEHKVLRALVRNYTAGVDHNCETFFSSIDDSSERAKLNDKVLLGTVLSLVRKHWIYFNREGNTFIVGWTCKEAFNKANNLPSHS